MAWVKNLKMQQKFLFVLLLHCKKYQAVVLLPEEANQKINIGLSDFIPASMDYNLVVSRSPALELGEHLRYLGAVSLWMYGANSFCSISSIILW